MSQFLYSREAIEQAAQDAVDLVDKVAESRQSSMDEAVEDGDLATSIVAEVLGTYGIDAEGVINMLLERRMMPLPMVAAFTTGMQVMAQAQLNQQRAAAEFAEQFDLNNTTEDN